MEQKQKMLVTSALPYANGDLHLGHMVGCIQADIWVRLHKMLGFDCLHISGSDSHGTPIMIQAEKLGITPEVMIEEVSAGQARDFQDFHVAFDNYYPTHSPENKMLVEEIYNVHLKKGNIAKHVISQLYDPVKNMFLPDRYIKGECPKCGAQDQYGDNCEVCGSTYSSIELINPYSTLTGAKPIAKESTHYFFKLQNYAEFLQEWTKANHLQPQVANKMQEWFAEGLREWDISRDAPYFGFTIPGETDKYFYVWLDAPIGYMASLKNLCARRLDILFEEYWKKNSNIPLYQFIGKDIIYFHSLFWPAILQGADLRTPTAIHVNGFLTINGQKMSKSRGTLIKARSYLEHFNPEYLRYYFATKLTQRIEDLDMQLDDFAQRVNADLVGKLINIASRCASFINKSFANRLSAEADHPELITQFADAGDEIKQLLLQLDYGHAARKIMALADIANQYVDEKKPWTLMKDPAQQTQVQAICTTAINLFRILIIYLKPILPEIAQKVETFLQIDPLIWGDKDKVLLDHVIATYEPLLTRIDPKQLEAFKMSLQNESVAPKETVATEKPAQPAHITIDDFNKIDLRIGKIIAAETIPEADKLLKLRVDIGGEERQIFAGIKSSYTPEQLIGRNVVVVANLAPRKMRFGISEGMVILASDPEGKLFLVSPEEGATPGMKVK